MRKLPHFGIFALLDKYTATRTIVRTLIAHVMSGGRDDTSPNSYAINPKNWYQTYKPHLKKIREQITAIDNSSMFELGSIVAREGMQ